MFWGASSCYFLLINFYDNLPRPPKYDETHKRPPREIWKGWYSLNAGWFMNIHATALSSFCGVGDEPNYFFRFPHSDA